MKVFSKFVLIMTLYYKFLPEYGFWEYSTLRFCSVLKMVQVLSCADFPDLLRNPAQ